MQCIELSEGAPNSYTWRSVSHPVCPADSLSHCCPKNGVHPGSRVRLLPQLSGGNIVTWFRAKHSPCLCFLPLLCCCSYCLWQLVLKSSLWRSALPTETSVKFPPKNSLSPHEWESDRFLLSDGDHVIMQFRAKNFTLSLSRMHDGSGSIAASIWL